MLFFNWINACYFVLLTRLFWYRKGWQACLPNIYCKSNIYAFVSNLTILTFPKVTDWHLLGGMYWRQLTQVGHKAQRWREVEKWEGIMSFHTDRFFKCNVLHSASLGTYSHSKPRLSIFPVFLFFFFNCDSLHARLNSHYEAWGYRKKKHNKITAYRKSV